jgi:hypothetical protein
MFKNLEYKFWTITAKKETTFKMYLWYMLIILKWILKQTGSYNTETVELAQDSVGFCEQDKLLGSLPVSPLKLDA